MRFWTCVRNNDIDDAAQICQAHSGAAFKLPQRTAIRVKTASATNEQWPWQGKNSCFTGNIFYCINFWRKSQAGLHKFLPHWIKLIKVNRGTQCCKQSKQRRMLLGEDNIGDVTFALNISWFQTGNIGRTEHLLWRQTVDFCNLFCNGIYYLFT